MKTAQKIINNLTNKIYIQPIKTIWLIFGNNQLYQDIHFTYTIL